MSVAAELIGSARRYRGMSGRALARAAHASQASLLDLERGASDATSDRLDRLLRPLGYQVALLPTRRGTATAAAAEVRGFLAADDEPGAFRVVWQLAEDLTSVEPAVQVALCVTPPAPTGSARFDALLAGVVDYLLSQAHLPRPCWLDEPWRRLEQGWDTEPVPALRERARQATPSALRAHGVFLDPSELVTS